MSTAELDVGAFRGPLDRFGELVKARSGLVVRSGDLTRVLPPSGNWKPRLRDHAFGMLKPGDRVEDEIGSGAILHRTIKAIRIQDSRQHTWSSGRTVSVMPTAIAAHCRRQNPMRPVGMLSKYCCSASVATARTRVSPSIEPRDATGTR